MAATSSSFDARKIRRKMAPENPDHREAKADQVLIDWRCAKQRHAYSSKLLDALRNIRRTSPPLINDYSSTRAVRETADKVLAAAARGRTRWSRAILSNKRLTGHRKAKARPKTTSAPELGGRRRKVPARRAKRSPAFQSRVRCLARLVPGCRKLPLSNLLEETTDYIAALEMQVGAMAALAELFAGSGLILKPNESS